MIRFYLVLFLFQGFILYAQNVNDSLKVLFIGNSYTFANMTPGNPELPYRIKQLANLSGKHLDYDVSLYGGKDLKWHFERQDALKKIESNNYDFVVLQDHSMGTIYAPDSFRRYVALFDSLIRLRGSKTLLYMTWGRAHKPKMIDTVAYHYVMAAQDASAAIAPCGLAWNHASITFPSAKQLLYKEDKSHPLPTGTLLNAMVFYQVLYGAPPDLKEFNIDQLDKNSLSQLANSAEKAYEALFKLENAYGKIVHRQE